MRLLLDTHVAVWAVDAPGTLPPGIAYLIESGAEEVVVSSVAIWEIAIKHRLMRPDSPPMSGHQAILEFQRAGFDIVDMNATHGAFVERLPVLHADPFDRIMLAQAIVEGYQFVTRDGHLRRYGAPVLDWEFKVP